VFDLWRIRSNRKLEEILGGEDIVKFVKSLRLAWLGHVDVDAKKAVAWEVGGKQETWKTKEKVVTGL
jgi:hypothetical protein